MRIRLLLAILALSFALTGRVQADLKLAMAEPNLEKRSRLALDNASAAYKELRSAYDKGELEAVSTAAKEIEESVELAHASLKQTGKIPRKSPKYFKAAEIATRDLVRRLEAFQREMSFDDRPMLESTKKKVQQVHDELLIGLMEGNRK